VSDAPGKRPTEAEDAISAILRAGVGASLLLIVAGTLLSFLRDGGYAPHRSEVARLTGEGGSFPRTWSWFLGGLVQLDGQAVIVAGLLVLIATPVLRVAVSAIVFARERDRTYVAITITVLLLLLLSFELGRAG
jgi:uncharacterized membrane protein